MTLLSWGQPLVLAQTPAVNLSEPSPPPEETAIDQPQLAIGDTGPLVQQLQFYLKELGYFSEQPNGEFGESTATAVRSLQSRKGLTVDGVMNTATWNVLITEYQVQHLDLSSPEASQAKLPDPTPSPKTDSVNLASPPTPEPSLAEKDLKDLDSPNTIAAETPATKTPPLTPDSPEPQGTEEAPSFPIVRTLLGLLTLGLGGICFWQLLRTLGNKSTANPPRPRIEKQSVEPVESVVPLQTLELVPDAQPPSGGVFSTEDVTAITYPIHDRSNTHQGSSSLARPELTTPELPWQPPLDKVEELISHLHSDTVGQRHQAIWELGQQADGRGIKPLMELLPVADSHEQSLILAAISEIGVKTFKPMKQVLAISLDSPNPEVRKNAIRDLHRVYETLLQATQLLKYSLNDPDPEVQETAAWAIEQMARLSHAQIPRQFKQDYTQE